AVTVRLYHAATGQPFGLPLRRPGSDGASARFSPDSKRILFGGLEWDLTTDKRSGEPIRQPPKPNPGWFFSNDRKLVLAVAAGGNTGVLRDAATDKQMGQPLQFPASPALVVFSPNRKTFVTLVIHGRAAPALRLPEQEKHEYRLWSAATAEPIGEPVVLP